MARGVYKSKRTAVLAGRRALRRMSSVSGVRGGRIPSRQARLVPVRVVGGWGITAKRK